MSGSTQPLASDGYERHMDEWGGVARFTAPLDIRLEYGYLLDEANYSVSFERH
jgi:uncharacterized protein involved in high-affinity Fe2+ transport